MRKADYSKKIPELEAKIAKKKAEIKALKSELASTKRKYLKENAANLLEYMDDNNINPQEVYNLIKK